MNKSILFLMLFNKMSGEFSSILDSYNNVKKYLNNISIKVIAEINKNVPLLRQYLPRDIEINFVNSKLQLQADTIVCSAFYFFQLSQNLINNFIRCKRLIILDSSSFLMAKLNNINIFESIKNFNCEELFILGNKFNSQFFNSNFYEYYHKFDFLRLEKYKDVKRNEIFIKKMFSHPLEYVGMNYKRQIKVKHNLPYIYYENIGKLIFEMNYLHRFVNYSSKNKYYDNDGLSYYLKLFGVNDNIDQELFLKQSDIVDRLGFHEDDLLLQILK